MSPKKDPISPKCTYNNKCSHKDNSLYLKSKFAKLCINKYSQSLSAAFNIHPHERQIHSVLIVRRLYLQWERRRRRRGTRSTVRVTLTYLCLLHSSSKSTPLQSPTGGNERGGGVEVFLRVETVPLPSSLVYTQFNYSSLGLATNPTTPCPVSACERQHDSHSPCWYACLRVPSCFHNCIFCLSTTLATLSCEEGRRREATKWN